MTPAYLNRVHEELEAIKAANRYRDVTAQGSKFFADFSTNDYLALAGDSRMVEAMRHVKRVGSGGARLLGGAHREHVLLEQDLAAWTGRERALVFSSGYLAAIGVIQVLSSCADVIYSDALNHACLIDGIRASGKPRVIFPHAQIPPPAGRRTPALIVTESLFGMDGDVAGIADYARSLNDGDILLVDEAHALGILGGNAGGVASGLLDPRIVILGTLGKAVGSAGGFVAGPSEVIELIVNSARTFIFDTALAPPLAFAARVGVMLAQNAADRRERLRSNVQYVREGLRARGLEASNDATPIIPVLLGSEAEALAAMKTARDNGVNAPAIRPPTVPAGSSRLRLSLRSDHTRDQLDLLLQAMPCTAIS